MQFESGLRKPVHSGCMHLCIDMQNLFGPGSPWFVPWSDNVLPNIVQICEHFSYATIFTRFIPPRSPEAAIGTWKNYFSRWRELTLEQINPDMTSLVPALRAFTPPGIVIDKSVYSPWTEGKLQRFLHRKRIHTLVITGAETDLFVLATLLGAVDRGYRVILVQDAVCSTSNEAHDATLTLCRQRFSEQLELVNTRELIRGWHR